MNLLRIVSQFALIAFLVVETTSAQWEAPADYYESATGQGAELKDQLSSIMADLHVQGKYGDFRYSAQIHDQDPAASGKIILVYDRLSVNNSWDSGSTWNREHLWPQSRQPGSASNSSRGSLGDPHAIRPATPSVNSARSNRPFAWFDTVGPYGPLPGSLWFPGDTDKGDVARSLFYSETRWASEGLSLADGTPSGNQMGDLNSLIAWHYLDPPDEFERRRNHTIFCSDCNPEYFTNNRNAFVDRPEFVWSIYVGNDNDSRITIAGGTETSDGGTNLELDFDPVIVGVGSPEAVDIELLKDGFDGTYFSVHAIESATCSLSGAHNAFAANGPDFKSVQVGLEYDGNVPGEKTGVVAIDNLDITTAGGTGRGSLDEDDFILLSQKVLNHANASLAADSDLTAGELDLGEFMVGQPIGPVEFAIHNLAAAEGPELTAALDLDSVNSNSPDLTVEGPLFERLPPNAAQTFSLTGVADQIGENEVTVEFQLSDEDLPGAATQSLLLNVTFEVAATSVPGDVNRDGVLNLQDIAPFVELLATQQYQAEADINGDQQVTLSDVPLFVELISGR